ncbi:hypothetical protein GCM10027072_60650 [Streptomyces bullii]
MISDSTATSAGLIAASEAYNASGAVPYHVRGVEEIGAFFDGLELVEPGIVRVTEWRPEGGTGAGGGADGSVGGAAGGAAGGSGVLVDAYCGVGRKVQAGASPVRADRLRGPRTSGDNRGMPASPSPVFPSRRPFRGRVVA